MRVALGVPHHLEEGLAARAERHGHAVVVRAGDAAELALNVATSPVDVAIVAATPTHVSDSLLASCDEAGVRVIGLITDDADRRHARLIGLGDTVLASSDWADIERLLTVDLSSTLGS